MKIGPIIISLKTDRGLGVIYHMLKLHIGLEKWSWRKRKRKLRKAVRQRPEPIRIVKSADWPETGDFKVDPIE